ncbi:hypothetical protein DY000_02060725 [Brassica cretica]|uniref:Uncharacterized protein n=1 Tax=Brassica cretica TaxID=69181 RepID=A0ABQ7AYB8_BRACR|nr:hypothetical protein DY000_02060725 [Brassica cretica]
MNTTPGYSSLPGEELNLEDMSPMAILDGMELGTLASLAPVTKTIEAENVKVVGVDQIDQVSEASRIDQGEILETNRESPAKERQKTKKRTVEKRQKKFAENRARELVGMDKMITSKSQSSLLRLRYFTTSQVSRLAVDDLPGSRLVNAEMMRQLHAVYGEWLLKDGCWNFVVDHFKGARMLFLSEGSTHADLVAMAQEDYILDMNTGSVELTYSLQQMAPDLPPIHVTSDRQVRNLLEITKTHEVRLCVSSFSKMRTVSEEMDEADDTQRIYILVLDNKLRHTHAFIGNNTGFIGAQSAKKLAISVHNVRTDVEDLQVSRPEDLLVSRPEDLLTLCFVSFSVDFMFYELLCGQP